MAQGLTLQQLQAMGAKPVATTPPVATTTPSKGGLTLQQLQAMGAKPVAPPEVSTGRKVAEIAAPSTTDLFDYTRASSRLKSGEIEQMQKERETLLRSGDPRSRARISEIDADIKDVMSKADKTIGQKAGMALGTGIELSGVAELGALAASAGRYGVRKLLGKAATEVAPKAVYTPFAGNKTVQAINRATTIAPKTAMEEEAFKAAPLLSKAKTIGVESAKMMPEALTFGYGYDVSQGLQEGEGAGSFKPGMTTAISAAIPPVFGGARVAKNALTPSKEKAVRGLEQTYTNLMSGTTPGKKKISKLEQKTEVMNKAGTEGRTPMRTLAEQGVIPNRSGTKLDTFDQAQEYRNNISYLKDANRKALEEVGLSSQLTHLDDLEASAIKYANSTRNIDSGRAPKMVKEIQNEFALLRQAYPDGVIPIGKVDEIKSARWDNVFGNKGLVDADVLKKDSEYAIAKSMQKHIEEVAGAAGNTEVAQLNREIGDRLEAAKFLEELNGKTIKGGRLLKYITTGIGSSMGSTIPGKIIGAIGGNAIGELIIANNVAGPMKRLMLRNLETQDPAAYTKTVEWLRNQKLDKETRLLLPAPKYMPMGGQDVKGNIVSPSGQKSAKPLEFLPQSKSPTNAQTTNAMSNDANIPTSVAPKAEMSPVDKEAMESMNYYFDQTDGPQFIRYYDNASQDYKTYKTSTSMADFPSHLKTRALFNRVKPYWDRQEVPKSPLMKELYDELQKRMQQNKAKIERVNNSVNDNPILDGQAFAGAPAGITQDEDGNTTFDPKMAALGVAGMSVAKKAKLSTKNTNTEAPKDLMALHNIHESNLEKVFSSGGLPAPSIAITKKDIAFNDFGEITLVGNPKLVTGDKTHVFGGDVYTIRVPQPHYNPIGTNDIDVILKENNIKTNSYDVYTSDKESFLNRYDYVPNIKSIADKIFGEPVVILKTTKPSGDLAKFITDKNVKNTFEKSRNFNDFWIQVNNNENLYSKVMEYAKKNFNGDDFELQQALEKDYNVEKPYTAKNMVEKMNEDLNTKNIGLRGTEKGWGTMAGTHVYGFKELKNMSDIKTESKNLVSKEETAKLADERIKSFEKFTDNNFSSFKFNTYGSSFDSSVENIVKKKQYENITAIKKEFGISDDKLAKKFGEKIRDTYERVKTQYMEAKALRLVTLNEFDGAVVPKHTSLSIIQKLKDEGIKVVFYDGTTKDRLKKIASFAGSAFGLMVLTNSSLPKDSK